eukprot:PhF_6_TR26314/c0_g1_i1/m.37807
MFEIFEVYVNIPKEYHGLILGPQGSTINSLRAEFDVNITILNTTIPSNGGGTNKSHEVPEGHDKFLLEECEIKMLPLVDAVSAIDDTSTPLVLKGYDKSRLEECKVKMLAMVDEAEAQNFASLKQIQYKGKRFKGRISRFSRNYGFIRCPATFATDVFVHGNEVVMEGGGAPELLERQLVTFSVVTVGRKVKAVNVRNHKGDPITPKTAIRAITYGVGERGQGFVERWDIGFGFIRG